MHKKQKSDGSNANKNISSTNASSKSNRMAKKKDL